MADMAPGEAPDNTPDPGPARRDTADWTWVLTRPCPQCGFRADDIRPDGITEIVRDAGRRYAAVLGRADVRVRPAKGVWSPLEYTCHARDVCDVMRGRLELILDSEGKDPARFENWDQDAAAVAGAYWKSDAEVVRGEVERAFEAAALAFEKPRREQWRWRGIRSNGSEFTAETLGQYLVHDLVHHLWDVEG
jgi:hypothetical protein